ncbi:hypothetical protein [Amycolatopsis jejuensis]|uniref:hypothetical protein n=1 Tax=Amycolatopsis jejuensis TaxID=330084 RepID=UPI000524D70D|nr:hypothetical protein [Amycolatopsis jejuensis]
MPRTFLGYPTNLAPLGADGTGRQQPGGCCTASSPGSGPAHRAPRVRPVGRSHHVRLAGRPAYSKWLGSAFAQLPCAATLPPAIARETVATLDLTRTLLESISDDAARELPLTGNVDHLIDSTDVLCHHERRPAAARALLRA